jgi:glycosyltransferase involved in cell wall biosynthesis
MKDLIILGIRGVPAKHGGFETFAEHLCLYLKKSDWKITVYCQEVGDGSVYESVWQGVNRVHIPVKNEGPIGTIIFDFRSIVHSLRYKGLFLTLGYNTAVFNILYRIFNKKNIINMDGIEWKRQKWSGLAKAWFWLNERCGCWFGNHLVADHPRIEEHLATRVKNSKITMIPYGGPNVLQADESILSDYDLHKQKYSILIARPEPENSILEVVLAFSAKLRNQKLVVLGQFKPDENTYHRSIMDAASNEVVFPGAIYDASRVGALRFYARYYIHGHQVGGTNPSLVEALGAGCSVIAHDNVFNRWVADDAAVYFSSQSNLEKFFDDDYLDDQLVAEKKLNAKHQFNTRFIWDDINGQYEALFLKYI